ncbi:DUF349 domain-containing protein [Demequina sp.]|uniref:DUF349 domain-containing protein n=1 Tax=Demequina sp. TaxID=2050685 RepID=UPI0025BAEE99|nr:DUF349 domain-containing protein [Demequina sp.]
MTPAKPRPIPRPKAPSPASLAAHATHPVKVPVVEKITPEQIAAASAFGAVDGDQVVVIEGETRTPVGPATGDEPISAYAKSFIELAAAVERFHARLVGAELSPKDIDDALTSLRSSLETPTVVGNLAALRARFGIVEAEANEVAEKVRAERAAAREEAAKAREVIVTQAEELAAKPAAQVHWKNDTARMRELLDEWKEAQRTGARMAKEAERALWKRFTHARSAFEKARKAHFAQLDKENSSVAGAKEQLVATAEALATSTDWDSTARQFKQLMDQWRNAGRGRRSVDDALWARFQAAQEAFFTARRAVAEQEEQALAGNLPAKEAALKDAEALLPIKDLRAAKRDLRVIQDRFDGAGEVPRADAQRLVRRMSAVEKAIREADQSAWTTRNPEIEARASGAAAQLHAAIAELEQQLAEAKAAKNTRKVKEFTEALAARKAWLKQIEAVAK